MQQVSGAGKDSLTTFLKDNSDFRVYDYSQLRVWFQCHAKYNAVYRHHIPDPAGIAAAYSEHVTHPMTVAWFSERPAPPDAPWDRMLLLKIPDWIKAFKRAIHEGSTTGRMRASTADLHLYSATTAEKLAYGLTRSFNTLPADVYELLDSEKIRWITLPDVPNAIWIAKPDAVLRRREDGAIGTVETKMSKYDFNSDMVSFDGQLLSQAYTTKAEFQFKLFFHAWVVNSRVVKSLAKSGPPSVNVELHMNLKQVDTTLLSEWLDETQTVISHIQHADKTNVWPKNAPGACHDFNRPCLMIDICALGKGLRSFALENVEKANPLDYLGL